MTRGVPITQLQCPTCGALFDRTVRREVDDAPTVRVDLPATVVSVGRLYIVCEHGHRWTLKTLWRSETMPDEVLLDRYIGGGELD